MEYKKKNLIDLATRSANAEINTTWIYAQESTSGSDAQKIQLKSIYDVVDGKISASISALSTLYSPKNNPVGGQNNYAPISNPVFIGGVTIGNSGQITENANGSISLPPDTSIIMYGDDIDIRSEFDKKAPKNNPVFTGNVVVPNGDASNEAVNKGQLDGLVYDGINSPSTSRALSANQGMALHETKAPKANPIFTGGVDMSGATSVTVPFVFAGDTSTKAANTHFVASSILRDAVLKNTLTGINLNTYKSPYDGIFEVNDAIFSLGETKFLLFQQLIGDSKTYQYVVSVTGKKYERLFGLDEELTTAWSALTINSPILTGTINVSGATFTGLDKADVGLGNVPNEDKTTLFTDPLVHGQIQMSDFSNDTDTALNGTDRVLGINTFKICPVPMWPNVVIGNIDADGIATEIVNLNVTGNIKSPRFSTSTSLPYYNKFNTSIKIVDELNSNKKLEIWEDGINLMNGSDKGLFLDIDNSYLKHDQNNYIAINPFDSYVKIASQAELIFDTGGVSSNANLYPSMNDSYSLGESSLRWSNIFAVTTAIGASDARLKTSVIPFTTDELNASKQLAKEIGTYKWLYAIQEKGDLARKHIGLTVQRAIEIMTANNLNPFDYGFICYDEWEDEFKTIPAVEYKEAWTEEIYKDDFSFVSELNEETGVKEIKRITNKILVDTIYHPEVQAKEEQIIKVKSAGSMYSFRHVDLLAFIARGFEERLTALENA